MSNTITGADLEAQVLAVRSRIAAAQRARSRAEMERDAAQAAADKARKQLADEFGVSSVEDAQAMLRTLQDELGQAVTDLRSQLDDIGV